MFVTVFTLLITVCSFTQESEQEVFGSRNSTYIEGQLGGNDEVAGYVSVNYDRLVGKKKKTLLRVGIAPTFEYVGCFIPTTISWITHPKSKSHVELGVGISNRLELFEGRLMYMPFTQGFVMYRYEGDRGFLLRTGMNALAYIIFPVNANLGISLGYRF